MEGTPKEHATHTAPDRIHVVSLNMLLDKTRSKLDPEDPGHVKKQYARLESQAASIADLAVPLDIVALSEVEGGNGDELAYSLGQTAGFWYEHNTQKRKSEHIGMFGNKVDDVTKVEIGDDKVAVVTRVGTVAVAALHLRHQFWGPERAEQMAVVLEYLKDENQAIIMGDFNALWFEKARRLVRAAGYESAFNVCGRQNPVTFPTEAYRDIMITKWLPTIFRNGVNLDDMYVKGVGVSYIDTFETDSDHLGLVATIDPRTEP